MRRNDRHRAALRRAGSGAALAGALAVLLIAPAATAQVDEGFSAQNFRPPIDPFGYVVTNGVRALKPGHPFFAAYVDYSEDTLDLRDIREGQIQEMTFVTAVAAIGLAEFGDHGGGLTLGVVVPYAAHMDGFGRDPRTGDPASATPPRVDLPDGRLADIRAELKLTLFDRTAPLGVALRGYGIFPTGEDKFFLSNDERFGAGGGLVLEKEIGGLLRIGGEFGYEWLEGKTVISTVPFFDPDDQELKLLTVDDKLHMRAGIGLRTFVDDLWLVADGHHWVRAAHPWYTSRESPLEVGGALRFERKLLAMVGASTRLNDGVGAPTLRVFASLGFHF